MGALAQRRGRHRAGLPREPPGRLNEPGATADGRERIARRVAGLRLAGLAVALLTAVLVLAGTGGLSAARVRGWVEPAGAVAPLAFIALSACLTVVIFPGPLLAGAAGLLFGTALGFPVSLTAAVLGACLAFVIARAIGGEAVVTLGGPRLLALRDAVSRRGFYSVLYARIVPGVPYGLVNHAAGLTAIRLPVFAAATALGAAPRAFAYTALGGSLGDLRSPEVVAAAAVLVAMALGGLLLLRRERRRESGSLTPPGPAGGSSSPGGPTADPP